MRRKPVRTFALVVGIGLLGLLTPSGSAAATPKAVDESRLQPALSASFAPWDCKMKRTGPVCRGERHLTQDWAPSPDFPCATPVWGARTEDRTQTRVYDHDYLNYDRMFRTKDTDFLATSPTGPATATIRTNTRFTEPFDDPGDDSTLTIITTGTVWNVKPVRGPSIFRAIGTLVEPYDAPATFTGYFMIHGVITSYDGALLDDIFSFENFVAWVCEAATGSSATAGA